MPFKSKAHWRACFAKNDPKWDCEEFAKETKVKYKDLPEKTASLFSKVSADLFSPTKAPPVPQVRIQQAAIEESKAAKRGGRSPAEYRNELTRRSAGIIQKNSITEKVS